MAHPDHIAKIRAEIVAAENASRQLFIGGLKEAHWQGVAQGLRMALEVLVGPDELGQLDEEGDAREGE